MTEERMKILKMLEDGKITAEEAEKLLSALDENRSIRRASIGDDIPEGVNIVSFVGKLLSSVLGMVPGVVFSAIKGGSSEIEETFSSEGIKEVNLDLSAADVEITTSEDSMIRIEGDGQVDIKKVDDVIEVRVPFGDLKVEIPENVFLYIRASAGDITMEKVSFPTRIDLQAGDVEIYYDRVKDLYINGMAGDVDIYLPKEEEFTLDCNVSMGSLRLPNELKGTKFPVTWGNNPSSEVKVYMTAGDVEIHFMEKEEESHE